MSNLHTSPNEGKMWVEICNLNHIPKIGGTESGSCWGTDPGTLLLSSLFFWEAASSGLLGHTWVWGGFVLVKSRLQFSLFSSSLHLFIFISPLSVILNLCFMLSVSRSLKWNQFKRTQRLYQLLNTGTFLQWQICAVQYVLYLYRLPSGLWAQVFFRIIINVSWKRKMLFRVQTTSPSVLRSPPLTQYFLECGALVRTDKKPALCKSYQKLVSDLWHKSR